MVALAFSFDDSNEASRDVIACLSRVLALPKYINKPNTYIIHDGIYHGAFHKW
jgi:hypothetical protein